MEKICEAQNHGCWDLKISINLENDQTLRPFEATNEDNIYFPSMEDQIKMSIKQTTNATIIWEALVLAFPIVGNWLC